MLGDRLLALCIGWLSTVGSSSLNSGLVCLSTTQTGCLTCWIQVCGPADADAGSSGLSVDDEPNSDMGHHELHITNSRQLVHVHQVVLPSDECKTLLYGNGLLSMPGFIY